MVNIWEKELNVILKVEKKLEWSFQSWLLCVYVTTKQLKF